MLARHDALQVSPSHSPADRVADLDDAVAELVKARSNLHVRAVGVVFAVEKVVPAPLAVPVSFVAHVQPGTEMEPRLRHRSQPERSYVTVLCLELDLSFDEPAIVRPEDELVLDVL